MFVHLLFVYIYYLYKSFKLHFYLYILVSLFDSVYYDRS